MATKGKTAVKAAPAVEVEVDEAVIAVGAQVKFLGYDADTPEEQQILTEGEVYEVVGITEPEGDEPGGNPILATPNPNFNAKKKESDANPKTLEAEVFPEEVELVDGEEEAEAEVEEAAPVKAAAKTPAKAAAAKAAAKTPAKAAAKTPAAKATKGKAPAKVAEEVEAVDPDAVPELETEDEEVLALVTGDDVDLIAVAQTLEADVGAKEWQLGGVLYHMKKAKTHLEVFGEDNKLVPEYQEKGGWAAFVRDFLNIDYRKAMYLIDIYVNFQLAGIESPAEKVASIGWTKASKIARHLVAEGANPEELLELAESNSVSDLSTALQEQVKVGPKGADTRETKKRTTLKFRLWEEEGASTQAVLEQAKEQLGLKDIGEALVHIVSEWASANAGGTATAETAPKQAVAKAVAKPAVKRAAVKS